MPRVATFFALADTLTLEQRLTRRRMLARLGLAWLLMMQVMMLAFPAYLHTAPVPVVASQRSFLDEAIVFMNWASLLLTLPVVWYCAAPVWQGAWTRMRRAHISMDVPVALGIVAAFIPSVYATWVQHGEVYFESVCMFVAFLLTARYLELCAAQASSLVENNTPGRDAVRFKQTLRRRADRLAVWFTVAQLALSLLVGAIWFAQQPERAVAVMVAMLVISCPCALAMAVPVSLAAGQARLAVQFAQPVQSQPQQPKIEQLIERCACQNLYGALVWHLLMMPLAAAGWVQPWLAAVTMLLSSLAVAGNGWRHFSRS